MSRLWVWGAGELGGRVATRWHASGHAVVPLTRTTLRHTELQNVGLTPKLGSPDAMTPDDILLISIAGTTALDDAVAVLESRPVPARVVITSSTGYYGNQGGHISVETSPGTTERAIAIAELEARFRAWAGHRGVIIRLGGLYRQGRGPLNAMKTKGSAPIGMPPDRVIPLVHYDDAAAACLEALRIENPRPAYLVVSPPCPTRQEFYLAASVILDLPLPSFGKPTARLPADYDISNTRTDLKYSPLHPRWQTALVP